MCFGDGLKWLNNNNNGCPFNDEATERVAASCGNLDPVACWITIQQPKCLLWKWMNKQWMDEANKCSYSVSQTKRKIHGNFEEFTSW